MKQLIMFALLLIGSNAALAQRAQVTSAWNYLRNNELANARTAIDKAAADETTMNQAKTWAYRGNIYIAIAVDSGKQALNVPNAIDEAHRSLVRAAELDAKKEFRDDIVKGLQTVAFIKFNEGVSPYNAQQYDKAYDAFKSVSDVYGVLNKNYNLGIVDTSATYYASYAALRSNRLTEATEGFNRLLEINKRPDVYQGLSLVALAQNDTAQALKYIEQGRTAFPDNAALMYDELNIYLAQNKNNEAIGKLQEAISKNPQSAELNYVLGNKYDLAIGDTANAIKYYNRALELKPDYFDVYYSAGAMHYNHAVKVNDQMNKLSLSEQKKYDELKVVRDRMFRRTLPFMEKAYQLNPKDRDTLLALKELYTRLNMNDQMAKISGELNAIDKK